MKGGNYFPRLKTPEAWKYVKKKHRKATISHPLTSGHVIDVGSGKITLGNTTGAKSSYELSSSHFLRNLANKRSNAELRTARLMNQDSSGYVVRPEFSIGEVASQKYRNNEHRKLTEAFIQEKQTRQSTLKQHLQNEKVKVERQPMTEEEYKASYSEKFYNTFDSRGETNA